MAMMCVRPGRVMNSSVDANQRSPWAERPLFRNSSQGRPDLMKPAVAWTIAAIGMAAACSHALAQDALKEGEKVLLEGAKSQITPSVPGAATTGAIPGAAGAATSVPGAQGVTTSLPGTPGATTMVPGVKDITGKVSGVPGTAAAVPGTATTVPGTAAAVPGTATTVPGLPKPWARAW